MDEGRYLELVIVVVIRLFALEGKHPAEFDCVEEVEVFVVVLAVDTEIVVDDVVAGRFGPAFRYFKFDVEIDKVGTVAHKPESDAFGKKKSLSLVVVEKCVVAVELWGFGLVEHEYCLLEHPAAIDACEQTRVGVFVGSQRNDFAQARFETQSTVIAGGHSICAVVTDDNAVASEDVAHTLHPVFEVVAAEPHVGIERYQPVGLVFVEPSDAEIKPRRLVETVHCGVLARGTRGEGFERHTIGREYGTELESNNMAFNIFVFCRTLSFNF